LPHGFETVLCAKISAKSSNHTVLLNPLWRKGYSATTRFYKNTPHGSYLLRYRLTTRFSAKSCAARATERSHGFGYFSAISL